MAIMTPYSRAFGAFILPVLDRFEGTSISSALADLNKSQWWSREEIETLQTKRLRALITHAYRNIPFYHRLFERVGLSPDAIRSLEDLSRLPILTKHDLQQHSCEMTPGKPFGKVMPGTSGGSTGTPVQFIRGSTDYSQAWAAAFRGWRWAGYCPGDRMYTLWGNPLGLKGKRRLKKKVQAILFRNSSLSAYEMTENMMHSYADHLSKQRSFFLRGYAQAIYEFARFLDKNEIPPPHIRAILTTAETLFPNQKTFIESILHCQVYDGYGGGEAPSAAYECGEGSGYHCSAENLIIECIRDGEPVAPGEEGRIVVTNLHSFALPFIRYDMEDIGAIGEDSCSCGRGLPLLSSLVGRVNDLVRTPEGGIINSNLFPVAFETVNGVEQFQVVQESLSSLLIRIVPRKQFKEKEIERVMQDIHRFTGENMTIRTELVDTIPVLSRSGKRRFVVSNIEGQQEGNIPE
jgi:phenylacetate-CoA ligase